MNLRNLFQLAKNHIASSWPESDLPLIRYEPLDQDSDTAFWSDMRYLADLKMEIFGEIRAGGFVWEMPIPVESQHEWVELKNELDRELLRFAHLFDTQEAA